MRVDYSDFIEQLGYPPPIAFRSRIELEKWLHETLEDLIIRELGKKGEAISIQGRIETVPMFEQIWVKAKSKTYRRAMKLVSFSNYEEDAIKGLDADHVLAKTLVSNMSDPWVALFPVPPRSNQQFGNIEDKLPKYDPLTERVDLTPLAAFKIYSGDFPKDIPELRRAMTEIWGQIRKTPFTVSFIEKMEKEMEEIIYKRSSK